MIDLYPVLELVREARIADLLGAGRAPDRLEASGVLVRNGLCHVVFDNLPELGLIDEGLAVPGVHRLVTLTGGRGDDYEDLAYDSDALARRAATVPRGYPSCRRRRSRRSARAPWLACTVASDPHCAG